VREYLQAHSVEFDDRNIRQSGEAKEELLALTGDLIVPLLIHGERRVVGFDPDQIDEVIAQYHAGAAR
jgi:glutaredoxin